LHRNPLLPIGYLDTDVQTSGTNDDQNEPIRPKPKPRPRLGKRAVGQKEREDTDSDDSDDSEDQLVPGLPIDVPENIV
jgi:hypothetical protein